MELRDYAATVGGREQLAVEATADAFEAVPRELARRAGLDPLDAVVDIRSEYFGDAFVGIDTERGEIRDATASSMSVPAPAVRTRLTDGVALGIGVCWTQGPVSHLQTRTGHRPYSDWFLSRSGDVVDAVCSRSGIVVPREEGFIRTGNRNQH